MLFIEYVPKLVYLFRIELIFVAAALGASFIFFVVVVTLIMNNQMNAI